MKNLDECKRFFTDAIRVGSLIASDHGARTVGVNVGIHEQLNPPSIASGVGQATHALLIGVVVWFDAEVTPVLRTRKFTIFHPTEGQDVWPGASMAVDDAGCEFWLHVGNRMSQSWGVFANWRDTSLVRSLEGFDLAMRQLNASDLKGACALPVSEFHYYG